MDRAVSFFIVIMFIFKAYGGEDNASFPEFSFETLSSDFIQEKYLSILQDKITIKGSVIIKKPDILRFETYTPVKQAILINKDLIEIKEGTNEIKKIKLSEISIMADNIYLLLNIFRGMDMGSYFTVNKINNESYIYECDPKEEKNKKFIKKIIFETDEKKNYLKWIKIEEPEGDYMLFNFSNIKYNVLIPESEFELITSFKHEN